MIVNRNNLRDLFVSYNAAFQNGFTTAQSDALMVSTMVPSTTTEEHYGWLGQMPRMREWIGDRVIRQFQSYDYRIKNKTFESSVAVKREEIEDDKYGVYMPMMTEIGGAAKTHPDELVFPLYNAGFSTPCYDRQFFFDTDHPVGREGSLTSVSNMQAGAGTPWFLIDASRSIKPILFQKRRDYAFRSVVNLEDSRVFDTDEFKFGVDARVNVGFGFWQTAFGSRADLTPDNFAAAYAAMQNFKSDEGRPMGIRPTHIVCPPTLRVAAMQIVRDRDAYGAQNVNANLVKVLDTPWLVA